MMPIRLNRFSGRNKKTALPKKTSQEISPSDINLFVLFPLRKQAMDYKIQLKVNGENYHIAVDPRRTLLEVIRNDLGLKGTKDGCGQGQCGACTVLLEGKAVNSCLILAVDADGKEILTIEGVASTEGLHPLQVSFIQHGAIQCGFCTPGVILSAKALLDKNPHPTEAEARKAIAGNLCRCTGYAKIVAAILTASKNDKG